MFAITTSRSRRHLRRPVLRVADTRAEAHDLAAKLCGLLQRTVYVIDDARNVEAFDWRPLASSQQRVIGPYDVAWHD